MSRNGVVEGERGSGSAEEAGADAMRLPRRLLLAGGLAVLLLAFGLVIAAFDASLQVDRRAIAVETARAERALALVGAAGPVDAAALERLETNFGLQGARLVAAEAAEPSEVTLPVPGETRLFAWTPQRPGSETFADLAPRRIALAACVLVVVGGLLYWLSRVARDLDRNRRAARALANRDALTGLGNRLHFDEVLRGPHGLAAPERRLALFYLDLDGFKTVNDTLGHAAGDRLLASLGQRLQALGGAEDFVARLGGDEFAIIRRGGLSREELAGFARAIIVETCRPHAVGSTELSVGISIGIAIAPMDAVTADELLSAADAALYRAKAETGPAFAFAQAIEKDLDVHAA